VLPPTWANLTRFHGVTDLKTGAKVALKLFDLGKAKDWKA
jgi:hypothetical protein